MNNQKVSPEKSEVKEATSLTIIKAIGLVLVIVALLNGGIWVALGVGLLDFVFILIIESTFYSDHPWVRHGVRRDLSKTFIILLGITTLVILFILFFRLFPILFRKK